MSKQTIMILNSNKSELRSLAQVLRTKYDVVLARHMKEAGHLLDRQKNIELVMVDYDSSEQSGIRFLFEVKKFYPHLKRLLMSDTIDPETLASAFHSDIVQRFISKSHDTVELFETVNELLSRLIPSNAGPSGDAYFLSGTLSGNRVGDIVQLVSNSKKSGILKLRIAGSAEIKIYFESGSIAGTNSDQQHLRLTFNKLMEVRTGHFSFLEFQSTTDAGVPAFRKEKYQESSTNLGNLVIG